MIDCLLFDLGGVLLPLNPSDSAAAFAHHGADSFMAIWRADTPQQSLRRFETGQIGSEQFVREMNAALGLDLAFEEFVAAFCAMLGNFLPLAPGWLASLRKQRRVYLLSNNNALHLGHIEQRTPKLRDSFERAYFSHEIAECKPDAAAFEFVRKDGQFGAETTLFVDDSGANIQAAAKLGFQTLLLPRNGDVVKAVTAYLEHHG